MWEGGGPEPWTKCRAFVEELSKFRVWVSVLQAPLICFTAELFSSFGPVVRYCCECFQGFKDIDHIFCHLASWLDVQTLFPAHMLISVIIKVIYTALIKTSNDLQTTGRLQVDLTGCEYVWDLLYILWRLFETVRLNCSFWAPPPAAAAWCCPPSRRGTVHIERA